MGLSKMRINQIVNDEKSKEILHSPTIKSTSAAEEMEAKQREIERLRAEKEALAERERKESQARMKAEGERTSLQNQLDGMVEMVKKEQSKKVEYITPPDVEDELASMQPVVRKRTPRFKASSMFHVKHELLTFPRMRR